MKLTDKNRLSIRFPELCKEWDYEKNYPLRPEDVSCGSGKKVWWICNGCGSKWKVKIFHRSAGSACPHCSCRKVTDKNRLSAVYPNLAKEWDYEKNYPLRPEDVSYGISLSVWWICCEKHSWKASLNRRSYGSGCPYCSGNRVSDKNRLSLIRPEVCDIWNYKKNKLTPHDFSYGSTEKAHFICPKNHEWETFIYAVRGCPYCINQAVNDENCFKNNYPELMKEWDYGRNTIRPEDIAGKSSKYAHWICKYNHRWQDTICHRVSGRNCPYCSNHRVTKENCLATRNPKLASEWHPTKNGKLTPYDVTLGSNKMAWWQCPECEYEWRTAINNRSTGGTSCCQCNRIRLKDGSTFDSIPEALLYLKLKGKGFEIEQRKLYGFGKYMCDFYLPQINTYIEVTAFNNKMSGYKSGAWKKYYRKIQRKRRYVENILKAKFRFIQINVNNKQKLYVRKNQFSS